MPPSIPNLVPMPAVAAGTIITMTMTTTTTTDRIALLHLLAWLSPAFPTGGYAYSHGLEWAVEAGNITDGESLRLWLADILLHGSGRNDAILLRHAHRADADHVALNDRAIAIAGSRERRAETL